MIQRHIYKHILSLAQGFPAVVIQGPRQSGKTTISKMCFPEKPYISLESPDNESFANSDPRGFLAQWPDGAILDEIQRCPSLIRYLQEILDASPQCGQFILTGSTQLLLQEQVAQSLAGRAGIATLLPLSYCELTDAHIAPTTLQETLWKGGYPPLFDRPVQKRDWFHAYIAQYVERDVRMLLNIRNLAQFTLFLHTCAAHVGQIVDMAKIGSHVGVDAKTIRHWLSILQVSSICFLLQPYYTNRTKRLVKKPKLYFYDTGLISHLLDIRQAKDITTHPYKGALFENWVITEVMKQHENNGETPSLYFWRDKIGLEIDLVIESGNKRKYIEIKSGATLANDWFGPIQKFADDGELFLIYGGEQKSIRKGVQVLPYTHIQQLSSE